MQQTQSLRSVILDKERRIRREKKTCGGMHWLEEKRHKRLFHDILFLSLKTADEEEVEEKENYADITTLLV